MSSATDKHDSNNNKSDSNESTDSDDEVKGNVTRRGLVGRVGGGRRRKNSSVWICNKDRQIGSTVRRLQVKRTILERCSSVVLTVVLGEVIDVVTKTLYSKLTISRETEVITSRVDEVSVESSQINFEDSFQQQRQQNLYLSIAPL